MHLSPSERYQELAAALESANDTNRRPIQALLLYYFGYTPDYLIKELNITVKDFRAWLRAYEMNGLAAFTPPERGVPNNLIDAIHQALAEPPSPMFAQGLPCWTVETLTLYLSWRMDKRLRTAEVKKALKVAGYRTKHFTRIEV